MASSVVAPLPGHMARASLFERGIWTTMDKSVGFESVLLSFFFKKKLFYCLELILLCCIFVLPYKLVGLLN